MKLTENFIIRDNPKLSSWGHERSKLKGKYKCEHENEVKTYKLTKKELEVYLKDIDSRPVNRRR